MRRGRVARSTEQTIPVKARVLVDVGRSLAFVRLRDRDEREFTVQVKAGTDIFERAQGVVDDINRRLAAMAQYRKR